MKRVILAGALIAPLLSCMPRPTSTSTPDDAASEDSRLALTLAHALADACPMAGVGDVNGRESCASKLANLPVLREHMSEPFLWGAQTTARAHRPEDGQTTRFNPLVWRKMYLSLQMFGGEHRIEQISGRTILHAATRFRSELDPGEYPYPFWHSTAKWDSYQLAAETLFVIERGKIIGALRSSEQDKGRRVVARAFDGNWTASPSVALYRRLFSPSNPHVDRLEGAYRAFEAASRPYNCAGCHRPDNPSGQPQLEMLCYPNQALASRHTIVRAIEAQQMPPPMAKGKPPGIADEAEHQRLLELARAFEKAAEVALSAEASYGRTEAVPSK